VFALGLPAYGVASGFDEGDWRGIYVHKNVLGRLMVVSGLAFLLIAMSCRSNCLIAWTLCGLSAAVLLASDSKTGLVIFLTVLVFLLLIKAGRWVYSRSLPFFITMVLASGGMATWFALNLNTVLRVLGRDMTLTGRTELWSVVLKMIWERPWFGYGYSAFWLGWQGESARVWLEIARWQPPHAHNGFLDLWLDVGLVGVAVFVLHFLAAYKRALSMARRAETAVGLWPLTYLTFMLLYNLMESTILGRNSVFFWALYVATTSSMLSQPATITEHGTAHCREDGASVEKQVEYNPNN
jgi:O-antigen ligase